MKQDINFKTVFWFIDMNYLEVSETQLTSTFWEIPSTGLLVIIILNVLVGNGKQMQEVLKDQMQIGIG